MVRLKDITGYCLMDGKLEMRMKYLCLNLVQEVPELRTLYDLILKRGHLHSIYIGPYKLIQCILL